MNFSVLIDVALGMTALLWLVATVASMVVEAIHSMLNQRASALQRFVQQMLTGEPIDMSARSSTDGVQASVEPVERPRTEPSLFGAVPGSALDVTDHPLLRRLWKPTAWLSSGDSPPSYIPSGLFSQALLDRLGQAFAAPLQLADVLTVIARAQIGNASPAVAREAIGLLAALKSLDLAQAVARLAALMAGLQAEVDSGTADKLLLPHDTTLPPAERAVYQLLLAELSDPAARQAAIQKPGDLVARLWPQIQPLLTDRPLAMPEIRRVAESGRLPPALAAALLPIVDAANHDIDAMRKGLEAWYDGVMERATGWFRRRTQIWLLLVSLLLAVFFNLDALYIGRRLMDDPAARAQWTAIAAQLQAAGTQASTVPLQVRFAQAFASNQADAASGPTPGLSAASTAAAPLSIHAASAAAPAPASRAAAAIEAPSRPAVDAQLKQAWLALRLLPSHPALSEPLLALSQAVIASGPGRAHQTEQTDPLQDDWQLLAGALCRVQLAAKPPTEAQRTKLLAHGDLQLANDEACRPARQLVLMPKEPEETGCTRLQRLWQTSQMTWAPALGASAWALLSQHSCVPADTMLIARFNTDLKATREQAEQQYREMRDAFLTMPQVGSLQKAQAAWAQANEPAAARLLSMLGWLITAALAALGAPMWFDLMGKLVNRRMSGSKPEPASGEAVT